MYRLVYDIKNEALEEKADSFLYENDVLFIRLKKKENSYCWLYNELLELHLRTF